jgi:uncharacterized protein YjbJ (UPF0337 family)
LHARIATAPTLKLSTERKEFHVNKDQVKGKLKEAAGEAQEQAGKVVGSTEQEARGHAREMEGKVQKKAGDLKEAAKDIAKKP